MDKLQVIRGVKKQVSDGELNAALAQLVTFLESEKQYEALCQDATQAQSFFQRTKREEANGTISFDNAKLSYNQITRQILTILDDLEDGRTTPTGTTPPAWRTWTLVGAGLLVVIAVVAFSLFNNEKEELPVAQGMEACPLFKSNSDSTFNILLFRYKPLGNLAPTRPHDGIIVKLGALISDYNLDVALEMYRDSNNNDVLPTNSKQATQIGEGCKAKLVIFGTEEPKADGSNIVSTQYRFLELGEQFKFTRLRINERAEIDTVTSVSSIATSGVVTGDIEQALLLLFGLVAYETQEYEQAIELLEQVEPRDSASFLARNMALQEAYFKTGQKDKQIAALDQVLIEHPNYKFALDIRSALLFQQGDYIAALQDLNTQVENSPADVSTITRRGVANLKAENFEEARQDFQTVQKQNPNDSLTRQRLQVIQEKKKEQQEVKKEAEQQLRVNPHNTEALTDKANATKSLGQYEEAIKAAEQAIKEDPKSVRPYATLIDIYTAMNLPEKAEAIKKRMIKATSKSKIRREAPQLRELIKRDSVQ